MSVCRIGSANASVLPEPVCAPPITSRPSRIAGIVAAWMGVGVVIDSIFSARTSVCEMPSAAKLGAGTSAIVAGHKKEWRMQRHAVLATMTAPTELYAVAYVGLLTQ